MASIKCPSCQKFISMDCSECPHCGFVLRRSFGKDFKSLVEHSDFEIVAHRGTNIKTSAAAYAVLVITIFLFMLLLAFGIVGLKDSPLWCINYLVIGSICLIMGIVYFIIAYKTSKKNYDLKYHNLYYDKDNEYFYSELKNGKIIKIDARSRIKMRFDLRGFNEAIIKVDRKKYNTGLCLESYRQINQRIKDIQSELESID